MKFKERRQYSLAFKVGAVQRSINSPETIRAVADKLGVSAKLLESWRRQMAKGTSRNHPAVRNEGPDKSVKQLASEIRRLEKKLERVELENEILKKATEYFDKLPK